MEGNNKQNLEEKKLDFGDQFSWEREDFYCIWIKENKKFDDFIF